MTANTNVPLNIPPAILSLTDVTASEKLLLALYLMEPKTRNSRALKVLNVGESGLKKIKRRLLSKGLVRPTGDGFKVLVPGLMPESGEAGGHKVPTSDAIEKKHKVAPLRKVRSLGEILRDYQNWMEELDDRPEGTHVEHLLDMTEATLREIQSDVAASPTKEIAVAWIIKHRDAWFSVAYVVDNLPRKHHNEFLRLIRHASAEQRAKLRQRIEQAQLTGGKPTLLLAQLSGKKG
jgi:hypothetical protein